MQNDESGRISALTKALAEIDTFELFGRVVGIKGLLIEVAGPLDSMPVGGRLDIENVSGGIIPAEVIGIEGDRAMVMPFGSIDGLGR